MPQKEYYGAQPPIELQHSQRTAHDTRDMAAVTTESWASWSHGAVLRLRQWHDHGGWYNRTLISSDRSFHVLMSMFSCIEWKGRVEILSPRGPKMREMSACLAAEAQERTEEIRHHRHGKDLSISKLGQSIQRGCRSTAVWCNDCLT